jgi:hypothetical protein
MSRVPIADRYIFDFAGVRFAKPFGMLYLAAAIRQFIAARQAVSAAARPEFMAQNFRHNTYLAHVGFLQSLGLDYGNAPGEARGSIDYVPVTALHRSDVARRAAGDPIGAGVEFEARRLAATLAQGAGGRILEVLEYSLLEIMRNVFEHSEADHLWVAAQHWARGTVEIAVLDEGIGVARSLARNQAYTGLSERAAIVKALEPGVTGYVAHRLDSLDYGNQSEWENQGYGLAVVSAIAQSAGRLVITSNDVGYRPSEVTSVFGGSPYFSAAIRGTAVCLQLQDYRLQTIDLNEVLRTIGRHEVSPRRSLTRGAFPD